METFHSIPLLQLCVDAFREHGGRIDSWRQVYTYVEHRLGGIKCFKTGRDICKTLFQGRIRTCVEEHSADSRQHYFSGGRLKNNGWRLCIFQNEELRRQNELISWRPYHRVKGGTWKLRDPDTDIKRPNQTILLAAELLYRRKGMQGRKGFVEDYVNKVYPKMVQHSVMV